MHLYEPKEHEKTFGIAPIGVKYICEYCGEGEMKLDHNPESRKMEEQYSSILYNHICTSCRKSLLLPEIYPKIEWTPLPEGYVIVIQDRGY